MAIPDNTNPRKQYATRLKTWVAAIALVVIAISLSVVSVCRQGARESDKPKPPRKSTRIATVNPVKSVAPRVALKDNQFDPNKMYEDGVEVVSYAVKTNSGGAVTEKFVLADGRKISKVHPPRPIFENPADQVIALALSANPGESMPPLPDLSGIDEDFARSLLAPIKILDTDPEDIKELKAKVIETKAYLVEEVKNGGSVIAALKTHQAEMERIADSRLMAIREIQKLQAENDPEMAREFAIKVNESFRARGIPEIPVPEN